MKCTFTNCVFHTESNEQNCFLPQDENIFLASKSGDILHCINCISDINELSEEGKAKLKKYTNQAKQTK